jgi:hypothetical protein
MRREFIIVSSLMAFTICTSNGYTQNETSPEGSGVTSSQSPSTTVVVPQSSGSSNLGGLLQNVKWLVNELVQVEVQDGKGKPKVRVKVPLVNVDVGGGRKRTVNVQAPFVNVTKQGKQPVSVQAPLTDVQSDGGKVNVQAPFTTVETTPGGTAVTAPFVNVEQQSSDENRSKYTARGDDFSF